MKATFMRWPGAAAGSSSSKRRVRDEALRSLLAATRGGLEAEDLDADPGRTGSVAPTSARQDESLVGAAATRRGSAALSRCAGPPRRAGSVVDRQSAMKPPVGVAIWLSSKPPPIDCCATGIAHATHPTNGASYGSASGQPTDPSQAHAQSVRRAPRDHRSQRPAGPLRLSMIGISVRSPFDSGVRSATASATARRGGSNRHDLPLARQGRSSASRARDAVCAA